MIISIALCPAAWQKLRLSFLIIHEKAIRSGRFSDRIYRFDWLRAGFALAADLHPGIRGEWIYDRGDHGIFLCHAVFLRSRLGAALGSDWTAPGIAREHGG